MKKAKVRKLLNLAANGEPFRCGVCGLYKECRLYEISDVNMRRGWAKGKENPTCFTSGLDENNPEYAMELVRIQEELNTPGATIHYCMFRMMKEVAKEVLPDFQEVRIG